MRHLKPQKKFEGHLILNKVSEVAIKASIFLLLFLEWEDWKESPQMTTHLIVKLRIQSTFLFRGTKSERPEMTGEMSSEFNQSPDGDFSLVYIKAKANQIS